MHEHRLRAFIAAARVLLGVRAGRRAAATTDRRHVGEPRQCHVHERLPVRLYGVDVAQILDEKSTRDGNFGWQRLIAAHKSGEDPLHAIEDKEQRRKSAWMGRTA